MDSQEPMDLSPLASPTYSSSSPVDTLSSFLPQTDDMDYISPFLLQQSTTAPSYPQHPQPQQCMPLSHILPPSYSVASSPPPSDSAEPEFQSRSTTRFDSPSSAETLVTAAVTTVSSSRKRGPTPLPASRPSKHSSPQDTSSAQAPPPKRPRAAPSGPISTKDWVPPDVTGLGKREARLVKNRAAAFLSRQRKREEFEQMEIRVHELEAENARLRQGTPHESGPSSVENDLRAQLEEAEDRQQALEAQIRELQAALLDAQDSANGTIKMEPEDDDDFKSCEGSPAPAQAARNVYTKEKEKSHSTMAFMPKVLLFSLSLLSANTAGTRPRVRPTFEPSAFSFSPPSAIPATPFDFSMDALLGQANNKREWESAFATDDDVLGIDSFGPLSTQSFGYDLNSRTNRDIMGFDLDVNGLGSSLDLGMGSLGLASPISLASSLPSQQARSGSISENKMQVSIRKSSSLSNGADESAGTVSFDLRFQPTSSGSGLEEGKASSVTVHVRKTAANDHSSGMSIADDEFESLSSLRNSSPSPSLSSATSSSSTPSPFSSFAQKNGTTQKITFEVRHDEGMEDAGEMGFEQGTWEVVIAQDA